MLPMLREAAADPRIVELFDLASDDEARHAEVCLDLAQRYAGATLEPPHVPSSPLPRFGASDIRLEAALLVTGTCCINETLATLWLEQCLLVASSPLSRAAHRAHLRDELDHARLGWAHLGSSAVDASIRTVLGRSLPQLLAANVPLWLREDPAAGIPAHGTPALTNLASAMTSAVVDVLLPGFVHVAVLTPEDLADPRRFVPGSLLALGA